MTNDAAPNWPQPGEPGWLVVNVKGSLMTAGPPKVYIDNQLAGASFGQNGVQVAPGTHVVRVESQWMRTYGKAALQVTVQPGETVHVYYAGPLNQWVNKGNIGLTEQKRPDTLSFTLLVVGATVLAVAVGIVAAL